MPKRRRNRRLNPGLHPVASSTGQISREDINALFSNRFTFNTGDQQDGENTNWQLPPAMDMYAERTSGETVSWSDERLSTLKDDLNAVKNQLSDLDIIQWRRHTQNVNSAGRLVSHLKATIGPELCTQAWCKFYEILCTYPLVQPSMLMVSVHLCEAPGAFIAALNHFLVLNHPDTKFSWLATTLNPYYDGNHRSETISDDRLIFHTIDHWDFGLNNTGNIFSRVNRRSLVERAKMLDGPPYLVTADGSMDCQNNPSEQEQMVSKLHLAEVATGLQILSPGGSFILKMFTCFEHTSVCLLYFLNCAFKKVHVYKPGTSKRGNSEVYIVCLGYQGADTVAGHIAAIDRYLDNCSNLDRPMFLYDVLPNTFMSQMISCCTYFKELQVNAIEENLRLFKLPGSSLHNFERIKHMVSRQFIARFGIAPIDEERALVGNKESVCTHTVGLNLGNRIPYRIFPARNVDFVDLLTKLQQKLNSRIAMYRPHHVGSYNERKLRASLPWSLRLLEYEKEFNAEWNFPQGPVDLDGGLSLKISDSIKLVVGQKFTCSFNSKFCDSSQIDLFDDLLECAKEANLNWESLTVETGFNDPGIVSHLLGSDIEFINSTGSSCIAELARFGDKAGVKVFVICLTSDFSDFKFCSSDCKMQLGQLSLAIKHISRFTSGKCVLTVDPPMTRISAGILYLLWHTFGKIQMWTTVIGGQPVELLFCEWNGKLCTSWLVQLEDIFKLDIKKDEAILEIIPINLLLCGSFYEAMRLFLRKSLSLRSSCLIRYLKHLANF